ncbi:MAG TPA: ATP-binding protein [Solirubrobacteraceae bacterium]|nr:ATP-binding protein [Solirubrobacteraceae bacterium]
MAVSWTHAYVAPGVGKTMLAIALGLKAVRTGYRVYYTTAADLVARTSRSAIEGRWQTTMRSGTARNSW